MEHSRTIEINASKRILRMKDVLCGSVITGTDKIRSGFGNGDCLFFDFEHRVFAVADGTERFPWASKDLLNRLYDSLVRFGVPDTALSWKELINKEVYSGQKFQHKTTFSCVAIAGDENGVTLFVSHGGDSVVTVMDSLNGSILHQTAGDMYFAGRSKVINDVSEHRITEKQYRVIISSDGFNDLFRFWIKQVLLSNVPDVFAAFPVDGIGEHIHRVLDEHKGRFEHDDIGFIIINPFNVEIIEGGKILIGGTQPHDEKHFINDHDAGLHNQWVAQHRWSEFADVFASVGIQV